MRNTNISISCLALFILSLSFFGCDEIGENDRVKEIDRNNINKTVLLEDFTGINCINCPQAHEAARKSKTIIGDNLVIVSIHAGPFATPNFKTEAGNAYQERFYPTNDSYPMGIVSRCKFDGSITSVNFSKWNSYILERLFNPYFMDIDLELKVNYSKEDKSFTVESLITPHSAIKDVKLQLWITENRIIYPQMSEEGRINNYEHNHVLRDAINGIWGESIEKNISMGSSKTHTSQPYSLNGKSWTPENLSIIGFLYDSHTDEIIEVKEIELIKQ